MTSGTPSKVLVLGSSGLLGNTLGPILASRGHRVITHSRASETQYRADLGDPRQTCDLLDEIIPDLIVNLVGLTDVDQCETHPNEAYIANVKTVENIVNWIKQENSACHLVHLSTDQIYDGVNPHCEEDVKLTNYYALSKYAGELAAKAAPSSILRTNFFGLGHCPKKNSLTDWLFSSLEKNQPIHVFEDVLFSPLSMTTLSNMIELVMRAKPIGVFNLGSHAGMSKADFAFAFAGELNFSTRAMTRATSSQAAFPKAYRPKDMRMDCSRFENALGVKLPSLITEIKQAAQEYL